MNEVTMRILQNLLFLLLQGAILVFYVVLAVINRDAFRKHWRAGLLFSLAIFLMMTPGVIFSIANFDPSAMLEHKDSSLPPAVFPVAVRIGIAIGILIHIVRIGWYMVLYVVAVAEWQKARRPLLPLEEEKVGLPWPQLGGAFAFGVFAGSVSMMIFYALGIGEGESITKLRHLFPNAAASSYAMRIFIATLSLLGLAVGEELFFRGGLLGFLVSRSRNSRVAMALPTVAVSLIWALGHISNTDAPLIKVIQIFILGLFFAEFARRSCIESAIAAHVGLNLSCALLTFTLYPLS